MTKNMQNMQINVPKYGKSPKYAIAGLVGLKRKLA
jgi:hypothetical protein